MDLTDPDGLYQGIKEYAANGTKLKAPFKCKITDVDTDGCGWDYIDLRLMLY